MKLTKVVLKVILQIFLLLMTSVFWFVALLGILVAAGGIIEGRAKLFFCGAGLVVVGAVVAAMLHDLINFLDEESWWSK